jgi:hypothetical protein
MSASTSTEETLRGKDASGGAAIEAAVERRVTGMINRLVRHQTTLPSLSRHSLKSSRFVIETGPISLLEMDQHQSLFHR